MEGVVHAAVGLGKVGADAERGLVLLAGTRGVVEGKDRAAVVDEGDKVAGVVFDGLGVDDARGVALAGVDEETAEFKEVGEVRLIELQDAEMVAASFEATAEMGKQEGAFEAEIDLALWGERSG